MSEGMKSSGIEWIGDIPSSWSLSKVAAQYQVMLGKMVENERTSLAQTETRYLCAANVTWDGISESPFKQMYLTDAEADKYSIEAGDAVVVEGGSIGTACQYDGQFGPIPIQNSLLRVRGQSPASNKYFVYWMQMAVSSGYLEVSCNKATLAHYTKEKLLHTPMLLIPDKELGAIVAILNRKAEVIDRALSLLGQQIETLEAYKRSLIQEAVTKGLNCDTSGWVVQPARYCVAFRQSGDWGAEPLYADEGEYCLRAADFDYAKLGFKGESNFVRREYTLGKFEMIQLEPGDILIEKSGGGEKTPVGRAVLYRGGFKAGFSNFMERLHVDQKQCLPEFFFYWWTAGYQTRAFVPYFNQTTGLQNLNTGKLLAENAIALPSLAEQRAIADYLDAKCASIDKAIDLKREQLETLRQQRQSLIYEYVTGKRRVS